MRARLAGTGRRLNADLTVPEMKRFCAVDADAESLLARAVQARRLSARGYHRVLRVARMAADLAGCEGIRLKTWHSRCFFVQTRDRHRPGRSALSGAAPRRSLSTGSAVDGRRSGRFRDPRSEPCGHASDDAVRSASRSRARLRVRRGRDGRDLGSRAGHRQRGARGRARCGRSDLGGARRGCRVVPRGRARPPTPARLRDPCERRAHFGFPPDAPPKRWTFAQRNTTIAALGLLTVVVEAPLGSGALITADEARRLGRPVYAVPGPIGVAASAGANALIATGAAKALTSPGMLLEALGSSARPLANAVDDVDARILDALASSPDGLDSLVRRVGTSAGDLSSRLARLVIRGAIAAAPDGRFVRR